MTATAKYEIPTNLVEWLSTIPTAVLHRGAWVETVCLHAGETTPRRINALDEALCVFCDGSRHVACPACHGDGVDCDAPRCNDGMVACPQWRARWCHEA